MVHIILKNYLNQHSVPVKFYDIFFKAHYADLEQSTGSKFSVFGFFTNDNILYNDPLQADYKWENNLAGFKWFYAGDVPLFVEVTMSMSGFKGEVAPKLSSEKPQRNEVNDISFDAKFNYVFESKDELHVGFEVKQLETKLYLENLFGAVSSCLTSNPT